MSGISTTRFEQTDNGTKAVFTDLQSLSRQMRDRSIFDLYANRLDADDETQTILRSLYITTDYGPKTTVRIASAAQPNTSSCTVEPHNLYYYETTLTERQPTAEEQAGYDDSFHDCPSPVYEIEMPKLDAFTAPETNESFKTAIAPESRLKQLAKELQEDIETRKWRHILSRHTGTRPNLEAEYDPDWEGNDPEETSGFNKGYYLASREAWQKTFNLSYNEYLETRLALCNRDYKHLNANERVIFSCVPQSKNETFCQKCGRIDATDHFMTIPDKINTDHTVCINCAEYSSDFKDETVTNAIKNHPLFTEDDRPTQYTL